MSCDCDLPAFFARADRTARKPHRCYECGDIVQPGARYLAISGKWDLHVSSFAVHVECDAWRSGLEDYIRTNQDGATSGLCDCIAFGELAEQLEEFTREVLCYDPETGAPC